MSKLCVVVPTYNRAASLQRCLTALARQTLPAHLYEVLVVVDGSTDDTMQLLGQLNVPYPLRVIEQPNSGQATALNRGIAAAQGETCVFIDDDIVVSPKCLEEHYTAQGVEARIVGVGQLTLELPDNAGWYARAFREGWSRHYDVLNRGLLPLTWADCYSGNLSAPRVELVESGGFDVSLARGFDVELAYRLQRRGNALIYLPRALGSQLENKGFAELSRDVQLAGMVAVELFAQGNGAFSDALLSRGERKSLKARIVRALLRLRVSPRLMASFGGYLPSLGWQYRYHSLIQNYCYERGVQIASRSLGISVFGDER